MKRSVLSTAFIILLASVISPGSMKKDDGISRILDLSGDAVNPELGKICFYRRPT